MKIAGLKAEIEVLQNDGVLEIEEQAKALKDAAKRFEAEQKSALAMEIAERKKQIAEEEQLNVDETVGVHPVGGHLGLDDVAKVELRTLDVETFKDKQKKALDTINLQLDSARERANKNKSKIKKKEEEIPLRIEDIVTQMKSTTLDLKDRRNTHINTEDEAYEAHNKFKRDIYF